MSDDIRSSTCCPSTLPDGDKGIWNYSVDENDATPAPEITCPDSFIAWLRSGQYIIPNFASAVAIDGLCQVDSEFTVTQNPVAGTVIAAAGITTVTITVTDSHGNSVNCNFTIDVRA